MRNSRRRQLSLVVAVVCWVSALPVLASDALVEGFQSPPQSAQPRVWWHWVNGNVSKEGIRNDLEWMKRIGIGGVQNFDGSLHTPQIVDERLIYMTPQWKDAFHYATTLADQLNLEFAIASSPGWSETGGPWVKPEDGMKKLVWSATHLAGARRFNSKLVAPPSVAGPFQAMPVADFLSQSTVEASQFYRDVAVIAYRTPQALEHDPEPIRVTTSASSVDGGALLDGDIAKSIALPISDTTPAWVLYDYGEPQQIRALSLAEPITTSFSAYWVLEASDDGKDFRRIAEVSRDPFSHMTISFPTITARWLRLTAKQMSVGDRFFDAAANAPGAELPIGLTRVELNELRFHAGSRIHRFEDKAGFSIASDYQAIESDAGIPNAVVEPRDIIDLTEKMRPDGTLQWTPPAGNWTVLRLGYSLTGTTNHPASAEATGLEVDKLDKRAVKAYLDTYFSNFESAVGVDLIGKRGIRAFVTDSIESRGQNWTAAMLAEFKTRRGYDMKPWLPVLTGVIVGNATRSDRFLWDFRKTLMELMSDAHYLQVAESVHGRGLVYYSEAVEAESSHALGDDLDMRQHADIPMGSIWTSYKREERDGLPKNILDVRGAASVAHVFGQNLVGAESLDSAFEPWAFSPASLRPVIDLAFALGVNRPVIHTSVHQPAEKKPGITLGPWGQHFTRHESWGDMAEGWITYLSRNAYLLQQGQFAADVAWFYGDGPLAALSDSPPADLPEGFGFDFVNSNILLNHLEARDGQLVSTGGAHYRLLYLGDRSAQMTLVVLRKLKELSDRGIAIAGRRPTGSPSLAEEKNKDEYRRLVATLWDSGKIVDSGDPNEVLAQLGLVRDFDYERTEPDSRVMFLHRELPDGDIYFLTNRKARTERIEARLRVAGKRPELWYADSGRRERVSWKMEQGRTMVPLELNANQSVFIVFREPTRKSEEQVPIPTYHLVTHIDGDWSLSFAPGRGAPEHAISTDLVDWSQSPQAGIKYFSGVGTYYKHFTLKPAQLKSAARVLLDLGQVHELAEVTLNGKTVGIAWHAPFCLDVTEVLKPGDNVLEIRVANLWVNRLIGDRQSGATPVASTVISTYRPDAPLRPSGLMGPVALWATAASNDIISKKKGNTTESNDRPL